VCIYASMHLNTCVHVDIRVALTRLNHSRFRLQNNQILSWRTICYMCSIIMHFVHCIFLRTLCALLLAC
jgi:hypothetical protein